MNKQKITRQLHRLAQEEIPDTMNLWPRIQGQLKRKSKPRSFSLAHALSVFVMLILVSVGGYAAYQSRSTTADPVAPEYVTPLALTQTVDGVTASIDWVYADAHLITLQYSIIYNPQELVNPDFSNIYLLRQSGTMFPLVSSGSSSGGGSDATSVKFSSQASFDASVLEDSPETLDLLFQINFTNGQDPFSYNAEFQPTVPPPDGMFIPTATPFPMDNGIFPPTVPPMASTVEFAVDGSMTATPIPMGDFQPTVPPPNASFESTATPFQSDFQPTVPPPDTMTIVPSLIPPMQFTPTPVSALPVHRIPFSFSVPFYAAKSGELASEWLETNGHAMQIQNLYITPTMSRFELCYDLPDAVGNWYPYVRLDTGYAPSPLLQFGRLIQSPEGRNLFVAELNPGNVNLIVGGVDTVCAPMRAAASFSPDGGEMEILVDYLYRYTDVTDPAVWEADVRFFRERGFDLSYAFEAINPGEEASFYQQIRPSNVLTYPIPEQGAILITIRDYPDTMQESQAFTYVYDHMLKERFEGPWVFEVNVE